MRTTTLGLCLIFAITGCGGGDSTVAMCGDGVCNGSETNATCCQDCGCAGGSICSANRCQAPMTTPPDMAQPPATSLSGELTCTSASACGSGLSCASVSGATTGVCLASCSASSDCGAGRQCINHGCLKTCTSSSDCASGMTCASSSTLGHLCVPSEWLLTGAGDPCTANGQCRSSYCAGSASSPGWCTHTCSANTGSGGCDGASSGGLNGRGQVNACVQATSGSNYCFPGCSSSADCSAFTGTTCKSALDITGSRLGICSL